MRPVTGCVLLWASSRKSSSFVFVKQASGLLGLVLRNPKTRRLPFRTAQGKSLRYGMPLAAGCQALDQRVGQAGLLHAFLNRGNVVRHAPIFNHLVIQIGDGKRGSRISVPGLADRAGVQQISGPWFHTQGGEFWPMIRAELNHPDLSVAVGKAALVVRVPEKGYVRGRFEKAAHGLPRNENVFVFVLVSAVNHREAVRGNRPGG